MVKNWVKIAGVCGVILVILSVISIVLNYFFLDYILSMTRVYILFIFIPLLISTILYILFYYGFVLVGKKYNNKSLLTASWLVLIYTILSFIVLTIRFAIGVNKWFLPFPFSSILFAFQVLSQLLFGISLIILAKKIRYALAAGILTLLDLFLGIPFLTQQVFIFLSYKGYASYFNYYSIIYTVLLSIILISILILETSILFEVSGKISRVRRNKK